ESDMPAILSRPTKSLIGASIPRSGHHFLQRILSGYFGDSLRYCQWYGPRDCCRQVPCIRTDHEVIYQKSHDLDFELPRDVAKALYIVQYRPPVPEALSDRELMTDTFAHESFEYRRTRESYAWWLASKAAYYRRFHDKWFRHRVSNGVYLNYEF